MEDKVKYELLAGTHTVGGIKVRTGGTFEEHPNKVEWMKHRLKRLGPLPEEKEENQRNVSYRKDHRGGGRYNVVNEETDKAINDVLLKKDEADELIESLSSGKVPKEKTESDEGIEDEEEEVS